MIIRICHARALGYCIPGIKKFIERYGESLDYTFKKFMKEGIDERLLKLTNDDMALKIIEKAKHGIK